MDKRMINDLIEIFDEEYNKRRLITPQNTAEKLIAKGYRKASEVALEVINTALSKIQIMISSIKEEEEIGNISEFNGGAKTALKIVFKDLVELKKKYTEEANNGT